MVCTIKGKQVGSLGVFRNILNTWIQLNIRFADVWQGKDKDVPWWYNERALLSVLSGAVWLQKGAMAFEEYSTIKKWKPRKEAKSKTYIGFMFPFNLTVYNRIKKYGECSIYYCSAYVLNRDLYIYKNKANLDDIRPPRAPCPEYK